MSDPESTVSEEAPAPALTSLGERLLVASNRLPIILEREEDGEWRVEPGSGGLVTAMRPVLRERGGIWVGWSGSVDTVGVNLHSLLEGIERQAGYRPALVELTERERDNYYYGFSNEMLWPLLHDLQTRYRFDPAYWEAYCQVNRKFAEVIARNASSADYVWVHDYHLMGVAKELRALGFESRTGYFLHTPFPSPDILVKLPWRFEILRGFLDYDLIGFQTLRDRRNFLECVTGFFEQTSVEGHGTVVTCQTPERRVRVGAFPISIDFGEFSRLAGSEEVRERREKLAESLPGRKLVLGVDRLDYTKGIPNRLEAFRVALEKYPELRQRVSLVQVVVPSREGIPEYDELKTRVEGMVGEINGRFAEEGWVPVHYIYRTLDRAELVAYYRSAAIALVTPLKDGMNLISKEYCASDLDEDGVLILSEFAGSAAQLQDGAIMVNPYDIVGMADAVRQAFAMENSERRRRMEGLRRVVQEEDIFTWVENFARAAEPGADVDGLRPLREYLPRAPASTTATGRTPA